MRNGFQDLGLVDDPGPGPTGVRADEVRAAAARWFVAANAVLIVEGTWPEDIALPLLAGVRPARAERTIRHVTRPSAITVAQSAS